MVVVVFGASTRDVDRQEAAGVPASRLPLQVPLDVPSTAVQPAVQVTDRQDELAARILAIQ